MFSSTAPSGKSMVRTPSVDRRVVPELVTSPPPTGSEVWLQFGEAPPNANSIRPEPLDEDSVLVLSKKFERIQFVQKRIRGRNNIRFIAVPC